MEKYEVQDTIDWLEVSTAPADVKAAAVIRNLLITQVDFSKPPQGYAVWRVAGMGGQSIPLGPITGWHFSNDNSNTGYKIRSAAIAAAWEDLFQTDKTLEPAYRAWKAVQK